MLDKMLELGYITQAQYDEAIAEDIYSKLVGMNTEDSSPSIHNYFVDQLVMDIADDLVEQRGMNRQQAYDMIYSGGLQIYSTMDADIQSTLEETYQKNELFPPNGRDELQVEYRISIMDSATKEQSHYSRTSIVNSQEEADAFVQSVKDELLNDSNELVADNTTITYALQSAMVIMDYHTGEVKALIGGRGEKTGDLVFNRASQALRQPGSCFKVLAAYAPAIDLGVVSPGTVIVDEPYTVDGWTPRNWYSGYRGPSTVREGIRDSMNILAAKTIVEVGVDRAFDYLLNFGFTTLVSEPDENGLSDRGPAISLGGITNGVTVMELTAAYGTIANKGIYNSPTCYTKVLDHDGNLLLQYEPDQKRVLKETSAFLLTDMMEDVVTGGGTGGLARFQVNSMPIAGKTGTTNDDKDLTSVGYTPYYVAGIWLGYDTPKAINYGGTSYHLLVWRDVMDQIHNDLPYVEFEMPSGILTRSLCGISGDSPVEGLCANDYYGNTVTTDYYAADSTQEFNSCSVHKSFEVDESTGMIANEYCPEDSVKSLVFAVDEENNILNVPSEQEEGAVQFNLNQVCTVHNEQNNGNEPERVIGDDGGSVDGLWPTNPLLPNDSSGSNTNVIGGDTNNSTTTDQSQGILNPGVSRPNDSSSDDDYVMGEDAGYDNNIFFPD